MMLRGVVAILSGLAVGALVAVVLVAVISGAMPDARDSPFVLFAIGAGIVMTIPGWGLGCAIILPVVTHRMRQGRAIAPIPYYTLATAIGAVAVLPTYMLLAASDPSLLAVMVPAGIAGGLTIAALWRRLILEPIAVRRTPAYGASLG